MTVQELIDELENYRDNFGEDAEVYFVCGYGDRHNTQQALPVDSVDGANNTRIVKSAYSDSGISLREEEDEDYDPDGEFVIILR